MKKVIAAVLVIVSLPVVLILVTAVTVKVLDQTNGSIVSSGEEREYLLHVPDSYDPATPTSLIISMHGAVLWPAQQKNISRWNLLADEHGFIVVYPSGTGTLKVWNVELGDRLVKDVEFISALIDTLEASYNIDPARIYANGLSNGGGMSFVLSCTLSDRIAAVGLVASAQALPWTWCTDSSPVPMMAFHGTDDWMVPYEGGRSVIAPPTITFPNIPDWTMKWAHRNLCDATPVKSVIAPDVTRTEYSNCAKDAAVTLFTITEGGHTWPGGKPLPEWLAGRTSNGVDATRRMWTFFSEHPL